MNPLTIIAFVMSIAGVHSGAVGLAGAYAGYPGLAGAGIASYAPGAAYAQAPLGLGLGYHGGLYNGGLGYHGGLGYAPAGIAAYSAPIAKSVVASPVSVYSGNALASPAIYSSSHGIAHAHAPALYGHGIAAAHAHPAAVYGHGIAAAPVHSYQSYGYHGLGVGHSGLGYAHL